MLKIASTSLSRKISNLAFSGDHQARSLDELFEPTAFCDDLAQGISVTPPLRVRFAPKRKNLTFGPAAGGYSSVVSRLDQSKNGRT